MSSTANKGNLEVRLLAPAENPALAGLGGAGEGVFYGAEWRGIFREALRSYGVFAADGTLVGGFQLMVQRRAGIAMWRNAPFTPVCGPLFGVRAKHAVAVFESRRKTLEAMAEFLAKQPRCVVFLSLDLEVSDVMPFCWQGFKATPRYTYQLDLRQPADAIWKGLSSVRRNDISKARRDGLVVEPATDLRVVRELVRSTMSRNAARLDLTLLDRILFEFARPENSYGLVTRREGRAIACAFVVHDRHTAYYLLGGYEGTDRHHGAGALAVMEAILAAQARGLTTFDFEGSMLPPVERFFRGFGGTLVHGFTVSRAWLPLEMALKFWKRSQF